MSPVSDIFYFGLLCLNNVKTTTLAADDKQIQRQGRNWADVDFSGGWNLADFGDNSVLAITWG